MTRRPSRLMEIARIALAALFAMGAIANVIMVAVQPDLYQDFASLALVPFYRQAWEQFVLPNLVVAIMGVAAFELVLALLMVRPNPSARVGLALTAAFMLALVPFWWAGGAVANVLLASFAAWLATGNYRSSAVQTLRRR